jgi:hypothetical protein
MSQAAVARVARRWIVSPAYDLAFFFGGAVASLAALGLYLAGVPILVLWWTWILAFDGPHIAAAFTRTYLDRDEWRRHGRLLAWSLLAFAAGPLALLAGRALHSAEPFQLFLGLAVFYAYYHVVRQHYGFLALYNTVERSSRAAFSIEKWALYVGCWTPYAYFLITHPKARAVLRLSATAEAGAAERALAAVLVAAWLIALTAPVAVVAREPRGNRMRPSSIYVLVTVALYGLIYLVVARAEPVYARSNGPDQDFLLLSVLVTLFHNVQYVGLVWFHNRNRYAGEGDFGPARALSARPWTFAAACLFFSGTVYLLLACATGVFPGCAILAGSSDTVRGASQVGLCLWWGLAVHHYWLDQRIWRVRGDALLRRNLGL